MPYLINNKIVYNKHMYQLLALDYKEEDNKYKNSYLASFLFSSLPLQRERRVNLT